jgi:predicted lactoylglutathione lyase
MKMTNMRAILAGLLAVAFFAGIGYALTPEQIIALKKAGVEDQTIRMMIQQEREAAQRNPADQIGRTEIKDKEGNSVILYSTGKSNQQAVDPEQEKVDQAWRMLQNMGIEQRPLGG